MLYVTINNYVYSKLCFKNDRFIVDKCINHNCSNESDK